MQEYLKKRIAELNEADAKFCKDRWDMSKPDIERKIYRDMSNEVTFARQELERALPFSNKTLEQLNSIEVCEIGQIKVMGVKGKNIIDAAKECISISNLLKVSVQLHWNNKVINIYRNTTVKDIIDKAAE